MAKVKFPDLTGVEDIPERDHAPVGIYRAKIVACEGPKPSSKGNQMLEVRLHLTHDAAGKKLKTEYNDIWEYPILDHDHPFVQNKLKEFQTALGVKLKGGALDPEGKTIQVKLKSDTDQDGEYRPRIGKWMPVTAADDEPDEDEEPDTDEEEAEEEEEEDAIDLDALDRTALKQLIKDEELGSLADLGIKKSTTDDQIREIIAEAMGGEEEEPEEEPEDDDEPEDEPEDDAGSDDEEGDDYDTWDVTALKKELKERELKQTGAKKVLIQRLRKDDGDEPF